MKVKAILYNLVVLVAVYCCLSPAVCFAQNKVPLDTIVHRTKLIMYKDPEKVIRIADSVYKSSAEDSPERVKALLMKAQGYTGKRDYEKSLDYLQKAEAMVQKTNDESLQATVINRLAIMYQQLKIYDKALENIDRCNEYIKNHNIKDATFILGTNNIVKGIIYKEQLSCELALDYFDKGIAQFNKIIGPRVQPNLSIAEYNKGQCHTAMNNYTTAEACYKKAVAYASSVNANSLEAFALKGLADMYARQGKNNQAIENFNKALELSKDVGDIVLEGTIYNGLAENYLLTGDTIRFRKYRELFLKSQSAVKEAERKAISDSVNELTNTQKKNILSLSRKFTITTLILVLSIFAALFFTARYYFRSRKTINAQKKKLQHILESRKGSN